MLTSIQLVDELEKIKHILKGAANTKSPIFSHVVNSKYSDLYRAFTQSVKNELIDMGFLGEYRDGILFTQNETAFTRYVNCFTKFLDENSKQPLVNMFDLPCFEKIKVLFEQNLNMLKSIANIYQLRYFQLKLGEMDSKSLLGQLPPEINDIIRRCTFSA